LTPVFAVNTLIASTRKRGDNSSLAHDPSSEAATAGGFQLTLVLGGARSGKSRYAESLIMALPPPWIYVATAQAGDAEMAERIAFHRVRRGAPWQTIEAPHDLAPALKTAPAGAPVLVDCLTLWLSNRMLAEVDVDAEIGRFEQALDRRAGTVVLVSNEVGSGIVPDNALARRFRDLQGRLNQRIAARADRVVLLVAGLPLIVKGRP
jgi:adenosylcobinamide kinase / adenosylcobinamide-phosphate guanylyltransferase